MGKKLSKVKNISLTIAKIWIWLESGSLNSIINPSNETFTIGVKMFGSEEMTLWHHHLVVYYRLVVEWLKRSPNVQGILNWILQILHYYCRKQHKKIENLGIIEQNLFLSLPFSLFTATYSSCRLPQRQEFFHFLDAILREF